MFFHLKVLNLSHIYKIFLLCKFVYSQVSGSWMRTLYQGIIVLTTILHYPTYIHDIQKLTYQEVGIPIFVVQLSSLTLFDPMDCSMPGLSLNSLPLKLGTPVTHMEFAMVLYVNLTRLKDAQRQLINIISGSIKMILRRD